LTVPWRLADAEAHLVSLELFGMRFGLDRMRRLLTALGSPQEAFSAIHVVGTNGKSSTVRMCAALLEAHGVRAGAFLSPHLTSFAERIRIGDADLDGDVFGAAVQRTAAAAAKVDRTLEPGDRVTQFELVTATAFAELARRGVEVAVVEAGLGGRHDATNVLGARTVVLTNVGLEHTRWLGPTIGDIAREKLAVVRPEATLVVGDLEPEAEEAVRRTAAARVTRGDASQAGALPGYQRRNFALAAAAAREHIGGLDPARVAKVAATISVPGRLQRVDERPLTIYDGAHNPSGMEALAEALPARRPLIAVVSILDDKDAAGMLRALLGHTAGAIFTSSENPRALPPATLASLAAQLGGPPSEIVPDPRAAVARARELAGPEGAVLATGSIYLVADLLTQPGRRRASAL
jgi:dihydrofolate synthase/folylpolyglutamate synthase